MLIKLLIFSLCLKYSFSNNDINEIIKFSNFYDLKSRILFEERIFIEKFYNLFNNLAFKLKYDKNIVNLIEKYRVDEINRVKNIWGNYSTFTKQSVIDNWNNIKSQYLKENI